MLALELEFYNDYTERFYKIKAFEDDIPEGWQIDVLRKEQLMDILVPWSDPPITPCGFPPNLSQEMLLEKVQCHTSANRPFISRDLAEEIAGMNSTKMQFCNILLLHGGLLHRRRFHHHWLLHRLFGSFDQEEGHPSRVMGDLYDDRCGPSSGTNGGIRAERPETS